MTRRRVVLHVGMPKSGTTYLQGRLRRNAGALAEHGVTVPRRPERPDGRGGWDVVFRGALDLTGVGLGRGKDFTEGRWDLLLAHLADLDGTVVASDEAFSRADDQAVARAVEGLRAGGDADVEVVVTVRDLTRTLVSGWLEGLKHGTATPYADYLAQARDGELGAMRTYDVPALVGRWAGAVGADRTHVVTVPVAGADPGLLWGRFCEVVGVDPDVAPEPPPRGNESVGLVEAQVLRLLQARLDGDGRRGGPAHAAVRDVVAAVLAGRAGDRVELHPEHVGWVTRTAVGWQEWLAGSGVRVVGDVAELVPVVPDALSWRDPDVVGADALDAALDALAALARERPATG